MGRRLTEVTILSRSVVRIWGVLERVLQRHEHQLSRSDRTMRVVHVTPEGGAHHIIGAPLLDPIFPPSPIKPEALNPKQEARSLACPLACLVSEPPAKGRPWAGGCLRSLLVNRSVVAGVMCSAIID